MPFYFFHWNDENRQYIADHDVTTEEFEEVVSNPDMQNHSRSSDRYVDFGWTSSGRYLCCVYEYWDEMTVYPVTAYELED